MINISEEQAEELIIKEIKRQYPDAKDFRTNRIGNNLIDGRAYYTNFVTEELEKSDSIYYAFINKDGCKLLDDGEKVIEHFENLLDRRKSFFQRISDFDLLDVVGAMLALLIVGAFVWLMLTAKNSDSVSREFLTIVSLVLGYYFGRNKPK